MKILLNWNMTALTIAGNSRYIIIAPGAWSTSDFNIDPH